MTDVILEYDNAGERFMYFTLISIVQNNLALSTDTIIPTAHNETFLLDSAGE